MTASAHQQPSHQRPAGLLGLGVAEGGLRLVAEERTLLPGERSLLRYRILADDAQPVTSFDIIHDRPMHLIIVRRDLTGFQHLHPQMSPDGTWSAELELPAPGSWRAFADFSTEGQPRTLGIDLAVPGEFRPEPLPPPTGEVEVAPLWVTLEADTGSPHASLRFGVRGEAGPVLLEPYLGAHGHLVALREGDLAFLHVHPIQESEEPGRVSFEATFPSPGLYRLFLQYLVGERVHTAAFTVVR